MSRIITKSLVVSTTPAYTAGDNVGGKISFGLMNATLNSVTLLDAGNQGAAGNLFLYDGDPTAATLTDNVAHAGVADFAKLIAVIPIPSYVTTAAKKTAHVSALNLPIKSTALFGVIVTTGTPTYVAVGDLTLKLGFGPHGE